MRFQDTRLLLLPLLFWVFSAASPLPGEARRIHVESDLALIEFVARDENGAPVDDLKPDEIKISVDGKQRELEFFESVDLSRPAEETASDEGEAGAAGVLERPAPVVFLVDLNSLEASSLEKVSGSIERFVSSRDAGRGGPYLLLSIGDQLGLKTELTRSPEEVVAASQALRTSKQRLSYRGLIDRIAGIFRGLYNFNPSQAMEQSLGESKTFLINLRKRIQSTMGALARAAELLEDLPGRKQVYFFSNGYPMDSGMTLYEVMRAYNQFAGRPIYPTHVLSAKLEFALGGDQSKPVAEAVAALNRARMTVYPVDVGGLDTRTLQDSPESSFIPRSLLSARNSEDLVAPREFLRSLASKSGGRLLSGTNEPAEQMIEAGLDRVRYYLAGFASDGEDRQEMVPLEVEATREGVTIRHRPEIRLQPPRKWNDHALATVFQFPAHFEDFEIVTRVDEADPRKVQILLSTVELAFVPMDGGHHNLLRLYGGLFDEQGRWVDLGKKYAFAREFDLELTEEKLVALRSNDTVTLGAGIEGLSPGRYRLIVVVRQEPSGLVASDEISLTVN